MVKFTDIIADYKTRRKRNPDPVVADCMKERSLVKVFEMAALARDKNGKKHPHQHRLPNKTLRTFSDRVITRAHEIRSAQSFDVLHSIIASCKTKGIGRLTIYDTAHRIGARLNIFPDMVYMHQGTKTGAEKYLKRKIKEQKLERKLFKHFAKLRCDEIEDILCIYQGSIRNGKCLPFKTMQTGC